MNCSNCGRIVIQPTGPVNAEILLVGDAPTVYDVKDGESWTGPAGEVLRNEMRMVGINYNKCRVMNMWEHAKAKDCQPNIDAVIQEMDGRKAVLLMGAEAVTFFTKENVSDVSGLEVQGDMLLEDTFVFAIFSPALALHDRLGEIRFGLERFAAAIKENNGRLSN